MAKEEYCIRFYNYDLESYVLYDSPFMSWDDAVSAAFDCKRALCDNDRIDVTIHERTHTRGATQEVAYVVYDPDNEYDDMTIDGYGIEIY